ncbi:pseudouridine synthase [Sphingomonas sp. CFBP 13728]|uniref:pseudouridine synthase n=1 Tax=Sphingomonas sp. CFBP 13728 TaxID=2775294 RepID=UPI0017828756|nr:pseudouridine synthase [Sphingomonas sp. CFBP 13728]MBD8618295.1 pseudouridine synthase [Sphingomonas sp. CFBP 13728]
MTTSKDDNPTASPSNDAPATSPETPAAPIKGDRIAKLLARAGIASRRDIERMIAEGRVALNGSILDTPATILRNLNGVTVDGDPVEAPSSARLFLYHKPTGLLVTERDPAGRTTIYDRLPRELPRLVPVGRLDLNTEGLLLMTTDGGLKRQLELPATGVERAYRARAYGNITQPQLEELIEGIEIEGVRYGSINANIERRTGANVWIEMILTEGKNREVRRVLEHLGLQVSRLIRTRYGPFVLGDLPPGQIGEVLQHDVVAFQKELAKGRPEGPGARANIGISASAGAGAGIGARSSQRGSNAPRPAPAARPAPGARPVSGARPAVGARTPVRSPYAAPASSGFSSGAVPTDRPSRPARPERIRPTAAMQRGDVNDPWARPDARNAARPTGTHHARPTSGEMSKPYVRQERADRGEELSTSPKIKHFRAAKPPRERAAPSRVGAGATVQRQEQPRGFRPQADDSRGRSSLDKRAARSASGRPGAEPRPVRSEGPARPERGSRPAAPGKGPSGGRGHPPRAPRGGKR